jgi:hypothetical protein
MKTRKESDARELSRMDPRDRAMIVAFRRGMATPYTPTPGATVPVKRLPSLVAEVLAAVFETNALAANFGVDSHWAKQVNP